MLDQSTLTNRSFSAFEVLSLPTVQYLHSQGFHYATPVQAAVLPIFASNKDVVVDACTGSGKTLAFLLPVLEKLNKMGTQFRKHDVLFMVISPTRELASQTFQVAQPLFHALSTFSILRLVGGRDVSADMKEIEETGGNVLIGTPGRIGDIMQRSKILNFKSVEVLVLDEADRLLDLGFEIQLLDIIKRLPKQRRTGLFSATQDEACATLIKAGLRNPLRINVTTVSATDNEKMLDLNMKTPQTLSLSALIVSTVQKPNYLVHFLQQHPNDKIIVYGLTCACVEYWFYIMRRMEALKNLTIRSLHGKMPHHGREKAIEAFRNDQSGFFKSNFVVLNLGCLGVLLATDVAARGLDIPCVNWVIQVDAPQDPRAFVHRVGRTARMGQSGRATILLAPKEQPYIKFLKLKRVPIELISSDACDQDYIPWLRGLSETDREAMLKGVTAFTSYIKAYSNHYCPYIFRVKDLDLGQLAYSYGLLYLPGMKEIKVKKDVDFVPSTVDPMSVRFVNKAREEERQKWIGRKSEKSEKVVVKSQRRMKANKRNRQAEDDVIERPKKTRNQRVRDYEELEEDYKMYKLEKKQKKTKTENNDTEQTIEEIYPQKIPLQNNTSRPQQDVKPQRKTDPALQDVLRQKLNKMKLLRSKKKH